MQDPDDAYYPSPEKTDLESRLRHWKWWYLLLLLPLAGLLYPPFYSRMDPMLDGIPFFIWYQFAWVFGGILTTLIVSKLTD